MGSCSQREKKTVPRQKIILENNREAGLRLKLRTASYYTERKSEAQSSEEKKLSTKKTELNFIFVQRMKKAYYRQMVEI